MRDALLLALVITAGCGRPTPTPAPRRCEPVVPEHSVASVFIDGRLIADAVPVVRTAVEPEAWDFEGDPPAAIRDLPTARIDLIQFVSGDQAAGYGACPGMVAVLITTRPGR